MLLPLAALLVCCTCVLTSELDTGTLGREETDDLLRREAEMRMETEPAKTDNLTNFFEIKDDTTTVCNCIDNKTKYFRLGLTNYAQKNRVEYIES